MRHKKTNAAAQPVTIDEQLRRAQARIAALETALLEAKKVHESARAVAQALIEGISVKARSEYAGTPDV